MVDIKIESRVQKVVHSLCERNFIFVIIIFILYKFLYSPIYTGCKCCLSAYYIVLSYNLRILRFFLLFDAVFGKTRKYVELLFPSACL